jgi:tRNA G18 (ribose-2'-O)-methylase SpoU
MAVGGLGYHPGGRAGGDTMTPLHIIHVTNPREPRLADYANIPDAELLARRGIFIAEGRLIVERLLRDRAWEVRSVLVTSAALTALSAALEARPDVPVFVVPQAIVAEITGVNIHRGALAAGVRPLPRDWSGVAAGARSLVILERLANADNVGAIFRAAAAFGISGVLLDSATTDPLYRKAMRTSMGAALAVPFAVTGDAPDTVPAVLRLLGASGWSVIGLTPAPEAAPLVEVLSTTGNQRVAIVVGHEGDGLTTDAREACRQLARIPMPGHASAQMDSLNVSTAAAIAFYELSRT